jgi:alkylation response protein AidB-like acyl-CoA dehydrogenase
MAKWFTGETAVRAAEEALQLHGGYQYTGDHNIERFYRDSKIVEIYEGSKEIEKRICLFLLSTFGVRKNECA